MKFTLQKKGFSKAYFIFIFLIFFYPSIIICLFWVFRIPKKNFKYKIKKGQKYKRFYINALYFSRFLLFFINIFIKKYIQSIILYIYTYICNVGYIYIIIIEIKYK